MFIVKEKDFLLRWAERVWPTRNEAQPNREGVASGSATKKLAHQRKKTIMVWCFKSLDMSFDKDRYQKEMDEVFNKTEKHNFNKRLNEVKEEHEKQQMRIANYQGESKYYMDHFSPDNSNIDATSKLGFMYRNTNTFPFKIQDKAYSMKYFLDCGVPDENLPKEYGVYESYEDFEKDINKFRNKDIVIKYNLGADCNQVIRVKKGEFDKKEDKIKELFYSYCGKHYFLTEEGDIKVTTDTVGGGHMKGVAKRLFVVQEDIAPCNENFPDDFKFWCINGKPAFCEVMTGRKSDLKCAFIDLTGKRMPLWHKFKKNMSNDELKEILSKLTNKQFEKMKELCKKVSKDIPLIRTDFCLGSDGEPKVIEAQDLYMMHLNSITFNDSCKEVIDNKYKKNMEQVAKTLGLKTGKYLTDLIYNSKTNKFDRKVFPFNKMIGNLIDLTLIKTEHIDNTDGEKATDEAKQYIGNLNEQKERFQKISSLIKKGDKKDFFKKTYKKGLINAKNKIKDIVSQKLETQKTLYWDCEGKDGKLMNGRNFMLSGSKYIDTINYNYDKNSQNNITYMNKLLKKAQTTPVDCGLFNCGCESVNNRKYANNGDANITKYQPQYYGNNIGGHY